MDCPLLTFIYPGFDCGSPPLFEANTVPLLVPLAQSPQLTHAHCSSKCGRRNFSNTIGSGHGEAIGHNLKTSYRKYPPKRGSGLGHLVELAVGVLPLDSHGTGLNSFLYELLFSTKDLVGSDARGS